MLCPPLAIVNRSSLQEDLRQLRDAQQLQHAWCHVAELQCAKALLEGGHFEANEHSQTRAVQITHTAEVDNDAATQRNERPDRVLQFTCGVTDYPASTFDRRRAVTQFIPRCCLLNFAVQGTLGRHRWPSSL